MPSVGPFEFSGTARREKALHVISDTTIAGASAALHRGGGLRLSEDVISVS